MLDADLVEWALNIPDQVKRARGEAKAVLKQAAMALMPAALVTRTKRGFSVPLARWFRGPMGAAFASDLDRHDGLAASGLFDISEVRALLASHRGGMRDHSRTLWSCWMFDQFLRKVHYEDCSAAYS
jgi:asparagine synthase (glutamine-hydrolysing)